MRVLREGELAVELVERDAVVGEVEEAVFFDGGFGELDEVRDDGRVGRIEEGEVDGVQAGPVEIFFCWFGWDPRWDGGLAGGGEWIERCCHLYLELSSAVGVFLFR